MGYTEENAKVIDRWVDEGWVWGQAISHEDYLKALAGDWQMVLTPNLPVPRAWFGEIRGKRILGLASGGAQQMPIFAALGGICSVLDYSERQIGSERRVAQREGYDIEAVRGDMTKPLPWPDETFDLIFHPVSNCYIEEVEPVWRECFRVLRHGGRLLAGLDNGINFLYDDDHSEREITQFLPFNPLKNPEQMELSRKYDYGMQFSHTINEQIAGQLHAGLRLLDVYEDTNESGYLKEHGVPTFWATLAVKD